MKDIDINVPKEVKPDGWDSRVSMFNYYMTLPPVCPLPCKMGNSLLLALYLFSHSGVTEPPLFCEEPTYAMWFSQGTRPSTGMDMSPRLGHYKSPSSEFRDRKATQSRAARVLTGLLRRSYWKR